MPKVSTKSWLKIEPMFEAKRAVSSELTGPLVRQMIMRDFMYFYLAIFWPEVYSFKAAKIDDIVSDMSGADTGYKSHPSNTVGLNPNVNNQAARTPARSPTRSGWCP